jgi:choline dehydrogenase
MVDVLVVGAGSSGSVVAARASEDPNRTVLLVEAGPDYPDLARIPDDLRNGHNNSYRDHDWGFSHESTADRTLAFPRGRVVGGSSAVNTAIALRGEPDDYEEWAALGNPDWKWDCVLPAFKRLERDLDFGADSYHGDAGPISIRRYPPAELLPQHAAFIEGARSLGHPACPDANAPGSSGVGPQPMNKLGRVRISCAVGYLAPARIRPNLEIRADTPVRRLLLERGRCVGVEVESAAGIERIHAKLVVLCAGAILTPAILLRSGIGPRAQLEAHGIEVARDVSGVGRNLSDHPALSVVCAARDPALVDFDRPLIQSVLRYTAPGSDRRNDLQLEGISFIGSRRGPPLLGVAACLEYQHGRGEVRLRSADPRAAPHIEQRFCEDPRDVAPLAAGFKEALRIVRSTPFADLVAEIRFPDPARSLDDEDIALLCRRFAGSGFHPCGTAKMGPASDAGAVVDSHGRCHAVDGLAVADASIMPAVPRANTNLTCIMIGEQIGEWLRTQPATYGL